MATTATALAREKRLLARSERRQATRARKKLEVADRRATQAAERHSAHHNEDVEAIQRRWEATAARHRLQDERRRLKREMECAWASESSVKLVLDFAYSQYMCERERDGVAWASESSVKLVLDFAYSQYMCERESASLCTQVVNSYAEVLKRCADRVGWRPVALALTNARPDSDIMRRIAAAGGSEGWPVPTRAEGFAAAVPILCSHTEVVCVLSPDADGPLLGPLQPGVYVIGGLCDYRRVRNASRREAERCGVACRRLPIRECLGAVSVEVLTVDQVAITLLEVANNGGDWEAALKAALPPRKLAALGSTASGSGTNSSDHTRNTSPSAAANWCACLAGRAYCLEGSKG
eukprot:CAMPEP_0183382496 /NCGR_PEP_ID=MMETSP0164_2-20130417/126976_1 /TAXON_ID=221442 /ORGANISM="Coccolithus pelagicus ssp braarudi, Strain PLY182g" /LENGTH=350 /DNA_ID=CAMNT_0025560119 /DNA_START=21 /DNA_END=1074 /DNA_ORIENTATION=-